MILVDAQCLTCTKIREVDLMSSGGLESPIMHYCDCSKTVVEHKRVWTAPHTGSGSSGEPAR